MQRPRKMEHAEDLNVTQKQQVMFCHLRQLLEQCSSIHLAPNTQCNVNVFDVKLALQQNPTNSPHMIDHHKNAEQDNISH